MGVDEGNLQVIDVDVILENCPITSSVVQYSSVKRPPHVFSTIFCNLLSCAMTLSAQDYHGNNHD